MKTLRQLHAICALIFFGLTGAAHADNRVALVIGNSQYRNAPRLPNPVNDANDVAAALIRSGFETIIATDLDKVGMDNAAIQFARAARSADVAIFYYAGHALQFGGINYLAPVDAKLTDEADLRRMVRIDEIVADMQQAKNLRILVLDSCRDNPLADELKRSIGQTRSLPLQRGLAKIDSPQGMIVSYATQSGRTASDGNGRNSPYTAAFLKHVEAKEEIGTIFRRITTDVYETTGRIQLPELSLSLIGEFYLRGKADIVVSTESPAREPRQDPCVGAIEHWKSVETIDSRSAFEDHIAKFPSCAFAGLARTKIDGLNLKVAARAPDLRTLKAFGLEFFDLTDEVRARHGLKQSVGGAIVKYADFSSSRPLLQPGDVIVNVGREAVDDAAHLQAMLFEARTKSPRRYLSVTAIDESGNWSSYEIK